MALDDSKSNQPNREELLMMAETTAKRGQREPARMMFRRVLEQDKRNERAMIWLARLAKTQKERQQWLERIVAINPHNEVAQKQLDKMAYRHAAKENRALLLYGTLAGVLVVTTVIVIIAVLALR